MLTWPRWTSEDRWESVQLQGFELEKRKEAAEAFNKYDPDSTLSISSSHFDALYDDLKGKGLTPHTKEQCRANMDSSADGKIQFSEYIAYLKAAGSFVASRNVH